MLSDMARYFVEPGLRLAVQVPEPDADRVLDALVAVDPLVWGDYDQVSFATALGTQTFRSLPGGRNSMTPTRVIVPCVELSVVLPVDPTIMDRAVRAVYRAHPYEEPVIVLTEVQRTRHVSGVDEDNPNRFWNRPDAPWVPKAHRSGSSSPQRPDP
ncbi:MAG: hypothetical protein GDA40_10500 [Rhodobacteraceae bacterium]|nr:hypothetical protein [Paracoccaceae bacterium]